MYEHSFIICHIIQNNINQSTHMHKQSNPHILSCSSTSPSAVSPAHQSFKQALRTFMLRMLAMTEQSSKFSLMHPPDELDQVFSRMLHGQQIKQSCIYELTNVQIKSDQHCLVIITLLYDLAKWAYDSINHAIIQTSAHSCRCQEHSKWCKKYDDGQCANIKCKLNSKNKLYLLRQCGIQISAIECIINQSLSILKTQRKHQTLISKQNQLIRILLQLIPTSIPLIIAKCSTSSSSSSSMKQQPISPPPTPTSPLHSTIIPQFAQYYSQLYSLLKQTKQSYPQTSKDQIKKNYNRGIEDSIKSINNLISSINTISSHIHFSPHGDHAQNNNQQLTILIQTMKSICKIIQYIHTKISQDIYKLINIFNTLVLNFSNNANNMTHSQISAICMSIYPESHALYHCNFSQILLSRIKILKYVIDTLMLISNSDVTAKLLQIYPFQKAYNHHTLSTLSASQFNKYPSISSTYSNQYLQQLTHRLYYNEYILHKSSHMLIQINAYIKVSNYYILGVVFTIYENIMKLLSKKQTSVPLYLYTHIVINSIKRIMGHNNSKHNLTPPTISSPSSTPLVNNSNINNITIPHLHIHVQSQNSGSSSSLAQFNQLVILQTLLTQISNIFKPEYIQYFLKLYDWNFMEEDICLYSIKCLYQFIEDSDNQQRQQYELYKKCLAVINKRIQAFLESNCNQSLSNSKEIPKESKDNQTDIKQANSEKSSKLKYKSPSRQRKQFYQLKKKQYLQIIQKMNKKPKQIFKTIQQLSKNGQQQMKQDYIQKCVRILKKSKDIQHRAMIDIVASNAPQSLQILQKYIQAFLKPTNLLSKTSASANADLQHYLRYIISNFFLSGQSQQIVRFVDKVTSQYFKHQNPSNTIFKHSDAVYTFANAIIILNTDQHNPKNVDKKMSVQAFMKMCEKINVGEDLAPEIIKETYKNIKQSQIHTFRNRFNMEKISLQCWMDIVNEYESVGIGYYDNDMAEISTEPQNQMESSNQLEKSQSSSEYRHINNGFREYANQLLLSVIDEKQTQKLQLMVQRFQYDDRKFDCEIIEKIRAMITNKKHIAMHILQKIYEQANFTTKKIDEKMLSYCWLAAGIIQNFHQSIPYSKITQYLLKTWKIGFQLRDNLTIRQNIEFKLISKLLKEYKKKESKKSIMDMFSKFLTSKQSQQSQEQSQVSSSSIPGAQPGNTSGARKKANILNSSFIVFKLLLKNSDSRTRAAETVLLSLRHQQSKRFQQFMSLFYLIFHLIYGEPSEKQIKGQTPLQQKSSQNSQITYQCMQIILNLLYDFYNISQTHQIGSRITSLKSKNIQKHDLIYTYAQYWTLKILFTWVASCSIQDRTLTSAQVQNRSKTIQKLKSIYNKCESFVTKINSNILTQIMSILDIQGMSYQAMINKYGITKQIVTGLRVAIQTFDIKLKYLQKQQKPAATRKTQTQSEKTQTQNFQEVQKYMKQLKMSTSKSQTEAKTPIQLQNQPKKQGQLLNKQQEENIQEKMKQQLGIKQVKQQKKQEKIVDRKQMQTQEKLKQNSNQNAKNQQQKNQQKALQEKKEILRNETQQKAQQIKQKQNKLQEAQKQEVKELNERKLATTEETKAKQNNLQNIKNDQQKKSNESNQQLGFPIYML